MKRNSLFTKAIALLVCAIMLIGYLPSVALPVAADTNDFESDIDVVETTEAPTEAPGAESNPIYLQFESNGEGALVAYTEEIAAGATVYYAIENLEGDVVFNNAQSFVLTYNETKYATTDWSDVVVPIVSDATNHAVFAITNNTEEAVTLTAMYTYPLGSVDNPQDLWDGDNSVTLEAGSQGWYFDYVGYADGYLTITVSGDSWQYFINNETAGTNGDTYTSADETLVASQTLEYIAGEKIVVFVNTLNAEDASDVTVNISFVAGFGTEESPYWLYDQMNTITVPADATVYYQGYFSGMDMTVNGENFEVIYNGETLAPVDGSVETAVSSENPRMPIVFAITNSGDADAEYQVNFTYPAGTMENPEVIGLGDHTATIAAGTQGYYYQYTAEKDGDLVLTVTSPENWFYVVNNMTSYAYGDSQWSDSDPVVNPYTVTVAAGDVIQIVVNTYDPEDSWNAPEGSVSINLAYACEHANTTTTSTATCTEAGVETVVCDDCGETISTTEVEALGHDYTGENGACVNCGEYQVDSTLDINKIGLSFQDYIGLNFRITKPSTYTSVYAIATQVTWDNTAKQFNTVQVRLEPIASGTKYYIFDHPVLANAMTELVTITVYGELDGVLHCGTTITTSVQEQAVVKCAALTTAAPGSVTILVNMLNYGATLQTRFEHNTDNLPDPGEYASYATQETPELTATSSTSGSGSISVDKVGLSMQDKVELQVRFVVAITEASNYEVRYTIEGDDTVYKVDGADFVKSGSTKSIARIAVKAQCMRSMFTIALYNKETGECVSASQIYSVEALGVAHIGTVNNDLVIALMKYGDSVATL